MGRAIPPKQAKFFIGLISANIELLDKVTAYFTRRFGPIDLSSAVLDFDSTIYYNREMGNALKRKFISFKRLISIENINVIKLLTNKQEKKFSSQGKRKVNIDPGYITLSKVALLTTKDYYHRIYLGKGIYAEVTLFYNNKSFRPFEWTYPDYRSVGYIGFFNKTRDLYHSQIKKSPC